MLRTSAGDSDMIDAEPHPCSSRPAINIGKPVLSAHTSEPAVNSATPKPHTRVGPRDCPSAEIANSDIVMASKYELATHTV
jgi:hypothetical protein